MTAVDWLFTTLDNILELYPSEWEKVSKAVEEAKEMEKEQCHNYADFCIRCDRDQMELLDFNDYIKIYTNGL
jgi:hypothetical protein